VQQLAEMKDDGDCSFDSCRLVWKSVSLLLLLLLLHCSHHQPDVRWQRKKHHRSITRTTTTTMVTDSEVLCVLGMKNAPNQHWKLKRPSYFWILVSSPQREKERRRMRMTPQQAGMIKKKVSPSPKNGCIIDDGDGCDFFF
jgi:hypothetical protein